MSSEFQELHDRAGVNNDVLNKVSLTLRILTVSTLLNVSSLQGVPLSWVKVTVLHAVVTQHSFAHLYVACLHMPELPQLGLGCLLQKGES